MFALHPLNVESVAWAAERKNVLSTLFLLITMWTYLRYTEKSSIKRYSLVFLFFTLGLMSKPMLVTFPFVLLLIDYWPLRRLKFEQERGNNEILEKNTAKGPGVFRLVLEKVPLFITCNRLKHCDLYRSKKFWEHELYGASYRFYTHYQRNGFILGIFGENGVARETGYVLPSSRVIICLYGKGYYAAWR